MANNIKMIVCPGCGNAVAKTSTKCPVCERNVKEHFEQITERKKDRFFNFIGYFFIFPLFIALWCNNINYLIDSWDREGLHLREVVAIIGIATPPIAAINGFIYFLEDEV